MLKFHSKIFKVCLAIFKQYTWNGSPILDQGTISIPPENIGFCGGTEMEHRVKVG